MPIIYALADPRTGETRYVGKTAKSLAVRLMQHLAETRRPGRTHHRATWLRALLRAGLLPMGRVLETATEEDWQDRERVWIAQLRAKGARLVNATSGGEGLVDPTPETRAKIGAAQRGNTWCLGRVASVETLAKMSAAAKGKRHTEAACAEMSRTRRGRKHTAETREKIAAALRGRAHTAEQTERQAAARRGRPLTPEHRAKLSAAGRGRPKSPEHRAKIAAAVRGRTR